MHINCEREKIILFDLFYPLVNYMIIQKMTKHSNPSERERKEI